MPSLMRSSLGFHCGVTPGLCSGAAAWRRLQSLPALHVLHSRRVPAVWEPPLCKLGVVAMVLDTCSTIGAPRGHRISL